MGEELDDIYEITTHDSAWWLSKAEYNRIKKLMASEQQNSVLVVSTLAGGEVVMFMFRIESLTSSTKASRGNNFTFNEAYKQEQADRKGGWE